MINIVEKMYKFLILNSRKSVRYPVSIRSGRGLTGLTRSFTYGKDTYLNSKYTTTQKRKLFAGLGT